MIFFPGLFYTISAKKIKTTMTIEKDSKNKYYKKEKDSIEISGTRIDIIDSLLIIDSSLGLNEYPVTKIRFSGFDKEPNSSKESFLLSNFTSKYLTGYNVRIDYLDMQGRMLHSRTLIEKCNVPPGETRRFDIPSWDLQHTYYYYLGNKPKKVATPFNVKFIPITFWLSDMPD